MKIVLIDDDESTLAVLSAFMRFLGHHVLAFSDPLQALAKLPTDTDLVVSDINMPTMDGFAVAEAVHAALGNRVPSVLLTSGGDHQAQLDMCPPSVIIGLMPKPASLSGVRRILLLLGQSRTQCPGSLLVLCPHASEPAAHAGADAPRPGPCCTSDYATCLHYNTVCGPALRLMVSGANTPKDEVFLHGQYD